MKLTEHGITQHYPQLSYYDEYVGDYVLKEFFNSGILNENNAIGKSEKGGVAKVGEKIIVQYTAKAQRVADKRYVSKNKYDLMHYLVPIICTASVGFISFLMLIVSILLYS